MLEPEGDEVIALVQKHSLTAVSYEKAAYRLSVLGFVQAAGWNRAYAVLYWRQAAEMEMLATFESLAGLS